MNILSGTLWGLAALAVPFGFALFCAWAVAEGFKNKALEEEELFRNEPICLGAWEDVDDEALFEPLPEEEYNKMMLDYVEAEIEAERLEKQTKILTTL